jgi:S1-C subfamily serine protease
MKRATLYSRSSRSLPMTPSASHDQTESSQTGIGNPARQSTRVNKTQSHNSGSNQSAQSALPTTDRSNVSAGWQLFIKKPWVLLSLGVLVGAVIVSQFKTEPINVTTLNKANVESIVLETLATKSLPARPAQVAAMVAPSIVSIQTLDSEPVPINQISEGGKGTGFVIKDDGTILTNYHIVAGAKYIKVTFADGMVSPAEIISAQPERDLAVLQPARIPDDLPAVTLAAGGQIAPGDLVVAVGFPFGMGLSVSAGIVSGLDRTFPIAGREPLTGLIQFDAAVNPGSSGGPLLNQNGEVVGVVTALFTPSPDGTFAGIGYAITMESAANSVGIPPF